MIAKSLENIENLPNQLTGAEVVGCLAVLLNSSDREGIERRGERGEGRGIRGVYWLPGSDVRVVT